MDYLAGVFLIHISVGVMLKRMKIAMLEVLDVRLTQEGLIRVEFGMSIGLITPGRSNLL
jgi:hypothetical protein